MVNVSSPFDGSCGGDFILRTSDGAEFNVYRTILGTASIMFQGMFAMPTPPSIDPEGGGSPSTGLETAAVDVAEDSETIDALLRCIYPIDNPSPISIQLAAKLTKAADKYIIPTSCLYPIYFFLLGVEEEEEGYKESENQFVRFALAWKLGFKRIALQASHEILQNRDYYSEHYMVSELAGDSDAESALLLAHQTRNIAMLQLSTLIGMKVGTILCNKCRADDSVMLDLVNNIRDGLTSTIQLDWETSKTEVVRGVQVKKYVEGVKGRIVRGATCKECQRITLPSNPPPRPLRLTTWPEIPNAIQWPSRKPDQTP